MRFGRVSNETLFGIREGMIGFLELALGEEAARDDLVRDLVDAELGSRPVLNRRNLGRALRNIKRRLVAFQDTSSLSYCPDKETRQGLRGFREEMRTCFPGFAEGISTLPLIQEAQNLGLPRYDRDFFSSLIRFSLLRNGPSSSEDTQLLIRKTLFLESKLVGTAIKFPDIKQGYQEFVAGLARERINIIGIACPNYLSGYRLGEGISQEAQLYIDNLPLFIQVASSLGVAVSGELLVANTEDDMPELLERLTQGSQEDFEKRCLRSVQAIRDELTSLAAGTENSVLRVDLLRTAIPDFRERQRLEERKIYQQLGRDSALLAQVNQVSAQRGNKYQEILGRRERDYELTIRYMAQYRALGRVARQRMLERGGLVVIFNYSTPNLREINAGVTASKEERVPVFEIQRG